VKGFDPHFRVQGRRTSIVDKEKRGVWKWFISHRVNPVPKEKDVHGCEKGPHNEAGRNNLGGEITDSSHLGRRKDRKLKRSEAVLIRSDARRHWNSL